MLGIYTLSSETHQYDINGLLPYGGYQVEVKALLLSTNEGSGYSGLLEPGNLVVGRSTTVNVTYAEGNHIFVIWCT